MVEAVKTIFSFAFSEKLGMHKKCVGGIFIVLTIDEVCLVWLETVPAECIGLSDPSFLGADIFSFMPLKICPRYS